MARPLKRLLHSGPVLGVLTWLISLYIRFVGATTRWEVIGEEHRASLREGEIPAIYCFWHGRLLLMSCFRPRRSRIHVMISTHRDGELIARTVAHFGFGFLRGSSSKGGAAALRAGVAAIRRGDSVTITPDGPRGPRMRAQAGAVTLARLTGAPLLPATFSTARARIARSWDRFFIALPFGRGIMAYGAPIPVPRDVSDEQMEAFRLQLENSLNEMTQYIDKKMEIEEILPDAPSVKVL